MSATKRKHKEIIVIDDDDKSVEVAIPSLANAMPEWIRKAKPKIEPKPSLVVTKPLVMVVEKPKLERPKLESVGPGEYKIVKPDSHLIFWDPIFDTKVKSTRIAVVIKEHAYMGVENDLMDAISKKMLKSIVKKSGLTMTSKIKVTSGDMGFAVVDVETINEKWNGILAPDVSCSMTHHHGFSGEKSKKVMTAFVTDSANPPPLWVRMKNDSMILVIVCAIDTETYGDDESDSDSA
jgi:hypothetical protein